MEHLKGLNAAQQEAVCTINGAVLVLAGAGSGKTRVITHRILEIIRSGVPANRILAVTFTNKAAAEMRERLHALLGQHAQPDDFGEVSVAMPTATTFHSLGVRILREHHERLGLPKHFAIYDRSDTMRAIKSAMEAANYSVKEFEPKNILSAISKAKSEGETPEKYLLNAKSYGARAAGEVWKRYENIMRESGALDFDDLLIKTHNLLRDHEDIRKGYQERWQYIHVDEFQDTNKIQMETLRLLAEHGNVCVVGDVDQCLVEGSKITLPDNTRAAIEDIKKGDMILSNYGSGDIRPAEVVRVYKKRNTKPCIKIVTESGKAIISTPEHTHFAGFLRNESPQTYITYMMWKKGVGFRIGVTATYTKGIKKPTLGYIQRSNQEHADALWILESFKTQNESRVLEYTLSLQYQIPTIPFIARRNSLKENGGYVHDQTVIDTIFSSVPTHENGRKLLALYGLSFEIPHHRPQTAEGKRLNVHISLCGDRRGKTPMHRISIVSQDAEVKNILEQLGLSVRPSKVGRASWRYESCYSSYEEVCTTVDMISSRIPETYLLNVARLGSQKSATLNHNSLPFTQASAVRKGMVMFSEDGGYEVVDTVVETAYEGYVYDIDVANTHNFIANGITTHNSIYSWRGAQIKNLLQFEEYFPDVKQIKLEENYRSTKVIIDASNAIIEKNKQRPEKTVYTNNEEGELIVCIYAENEKNEAREVAKKIKGLIDAGTKPSQIAIIYRMNFQSRVLEEAMITKGIPYQLLGTKFFERAEVKDVLSYLRYILSENKGDFARIINVPKRGIGKVSMDKILAGDRASITPQAKGALMNFDGVVSKIRENVYVQPVDTTLRAIIEDTGLEASLRAGGDEGEERLQNVYELVALATKYSHLEPNEAVEQLLEEAALQSDQDELGKDENVADAVRIMTIHASKGLEFPHVFITGLEKGLFPSEGFDPSSKRDTEEERRLFYVALTRAGKRAYLSMAQSRMVFGSTRYNEPSVFLGDIPHELVEEERPEARQPVHSGFGNYGGGQSDTSKKRGLLDDDWGESTTVWL